MQAGWRGLREQVHHPSPRGDAVDPHQPHAQQLIVDRYQSSRAIHKLISLYATVLPHR